MYYGVLCYLEPSIVFKAKVARHVRITDRIRQLRNKIKKIDDVVVFIVYCQYGKVRQYKHRRIYLGFFFSFISRMICYVLNIVLSSSVGSGSLPHQTTL